MSCEIIKMIMVRESTRVEELPPSWLRNQSKTRRTHSGESLSHCDQHNEL